MYKVSRIEYIDNIERIEEKRELDLNINLFVLIRFCFQSEFNNIPICLRES